MYQAPDFVKVDISVKDIYARYGCPPDEFAIGQWTSPCEGTQQWKPTTIMNDPALAMAHYCYTTEQP